MATPHQLDPQPDWVAELSSTLMGQSLLAGRLVATAISNIDGRHITVRFSAKSPPEGRGRWQLVPLLGAKRVYIDVPGHDLKQGDQVGTLDVKAGVLWATNTDSRRVNAARYVLLVALGRLPGERVLQETVCFYCGRPLTDPVSIKRGIGPKCYGSITNSQHEVKGTDDFDHPDADYDRMQRAGERGDMAEVERLAERQTQAEVDRLGSLEKVAGVPEEMEFVTVGAGQDPRELA